MVNGMPMPKLSSDNDGGALRDVYVVSSSKIDFLHPIPGWVQTVVLSRSQGNGFV
jgi:hypothetical protein